MTAAIPSDRESPLRDFEPGTPDLIYERQGPLGILTFNRPESRNAMTTDMYEGLFAACAHVDADERIRVFLLRGAGDRSFIAGSDVSQFLGFTTAEHALDYERRGDRYFGRLENVTKPTIAVLRGACAGGGAFIALACDLRIASTDVRFGVPIARTLGNTISTRNIRRLVDALGASRTKELLYTARFIDAHEGRTIGLLNQIVEPETLDTASVQLGELIAANAPLTVRSVKSGVHRAVAGISYEGPEEDERVLSCYLSDDFKEGVSAFMEKRSPRWTGH